MGRDPGGETPARQSLMRSRFISGVTLMAPTIPVMMTITAVSDGMPPIFSAMPIAIGVVTDFGASDRQFPG